MESIYYLNQKPVAKFDIQKKELIIIDPNILLENRHSVLTCSTKEDNNIKIVHHLHLQLSKQKMNDVHKNMLNNSYEDEQE